MTFSTENANQGVGGRWCVFRGEREFCLPVAQLHEIRAWQPLAKLPLAPRRVLGIFALGQVAVPVIVADGGDPGDFTHVLVARAGEGGAALFGVAACEPRMVDDETPPAQVLDAAALLADI